MASHSVWTSANLSLYQVQKSNVWHYFGFPAVHALAVLFLNTARACGDHSCVWFAASLDYYIHCFIHQFCLQLIATSCGFAVNSSYRDIIDYRDNLQRISQNIVIIFLSHRPNVYIRN